RGESRSLASLGMTNWCRSEARGLRRRPALAPDHGAVAPSLFVEQTPDHPTAVVDVQNTAGSRRRTCFREHLDAARSRPHDRSAVVNCAIGHPADITNVVDRYSKVARIRSCPSARRKLFNG